MQTFYLQYVKPACVRFLQHPYTTGESIQKQGPKIEEIVWLTALPLGVVCSAQIPGKAAVGTRHPLHSELQVAPKENQHCTHITIHGVLKTPHSTVLFPSDGHCSKTTLRGSGSAGSVSLGEKQLRGPASSGVQSTGLAAYTDYSMTHKQRSINTTVIVQVSISLGFSAKKDKLYFCSWMHCVQYSSWSLHKMCIFQRLLNWVLSIEKKSTWELPNFSG